MSKFQDVFDIKKLDDQQIGHLQYVLHSPSYADVFEPYLKRMRESLATRLLNPSSTRKREYSDDFIRGSIVMIDGLLTLFARLIQETEFERLARINEGLTDQDRYDILRREGQIKPMTGIIEEENIEEDY